MIETDERPKVLLAGSSEAQSLSLECLLGDRGVNVLNAPDTSTAAELVDEHPDIALAHVGRNVFDLECGGDPDAFIRQTIQPHGIRFARRTTGPDLVPSDVRGERVISTSEIEPQEEVDAIMEMLQSR